MDKKAINQHKKLAMGAQDVGFKKGGEVPAAPAPKSGKKMNKGGACYKKGGKT